VTDSPALPKPAQAPRPPVLIGGSGKRRTPRLAARYADEFNVPFASLDDTSRTFGRVRRACAAGGRAESSMIYSVAQTVCCGRTPAELEGRAAAIGRDLDDLRANAVAGTPGEIADRLAEFAKVGAARAYLQVLDLHDLDHLELLAELLE
jgi:alkanesulfonate monooxygenase SsuD/methylene tetrahydromethanopterin reductase-like flavin-dependent oxidoreductase (luciferase family)